MCIQANVQPVNNQIYKRTIKTESKLPLVLFSYNVNNITVSLCFSKKNLFKLDYKLPMLHTFDNGSIIYSKYIIGLIFQTFKWDHYNFKIFK